MPTQDPPNNPKPSPWRGATWQSNLLVGTILLLAGITETLTLVGTNSYAALAWVGAGLITWGIIGWLRARTSP